LHKETISTPRLALIALLFASMVAGLAFSSQPLNISVTPQYTVRLDSNQSIMTFISNATGGTPYPGQLNLSSSYTYQWYIQKNTTCPGINPVYKYQIPNLKYSPTGVTSNCMLTVQASDYLANSVFGSTGRIMVNPALNATGILNQTAYNITQGQNVTVSMVSAPTGGTPPYRYQWLIARSIGGPFLSSTANSICAVNPNSLNCVIRSNSSTPTGLYDLQLSYSDSATAAPMLLSKTILLRIAPNLKASSSSVATTSSATTTSTSTTSSTTSSTTTTIIPQTPLGSSIEIATDVKGIAVHWLDTVLKYLV
jgi:hypothetical protein